MASLAVGIRSFPNEGLNAENHLREAYMTQLTRLGGQVSVGFVLLLASLSAYRSAARTGEKYMSCLLVERQA